ncbi:MAG: hypothetical protein ABMA14_10800 [Hyphomonadaceae bacterium]
MSLMNVVRIAKLLALLAFVLPWAAVSCQDVDVATASGIELIQGKMTMNPDANRQMNQKMGSMMGGDAGAPASQGGFGGASNGGATEAMPDLGMNFIGIGAAAVILVGLLLSFVGTTKSAARNVLVTSLLGLALCYGTIWMWKEQVKGQSPRDGGTGAAESSFGGGGAGGMGAMGANMIDNMLQERFGYWIAISALVVAAGAGAIGMAAGGAGAVKQDQAPPAA